MPMIEFTFIHAEPPHEKRKAFVKTDSIEYLREPDDKHILTGGRCCICTRDSILLAEETYEEIKRRLTTAEVKG